MRKILFAIVAYNFVTNINNNLKLKKMAHTMQELLEKVAERDTLDKSVLELLGSVKKKLDDLLSKPNVSIPSDVQDSIDKMFDDLSANNQKVSNALVSSTPIETAPQPAPAETVPVPQAEATQPATNAPKQAPTDGTGAPI